MAIRLEEYNKNQRVYNKSQNISSYHYDQDHENESKDSNYNENSWNDSSIRSQEVHNDKISNTTQYIRGKDNQFMKLENGENYRARWDSLPKTSYEHQKSRNVWRVKIFYCAMIIMVFLFTPYLITISMTGVIEGNISDTMSEVRRVNVKYKNGSEAMDISKYMVGVLASRLSSSSEVEVLKAESIMVRTEIYRCMGDEMSIDSTNLNLQYLSDKELKSLWGDSYTANYNLITDCISATSGKVINYNEQLIEPMYHVVSAGKTRNGSQVFSGSTADYSYLTSVACEHDLEANDYLAVKTFSYDDFIKGLTSQNKDISISKDNPAESVQIVSRDSADYVLKIQAGNVVMTGEEFAKALGLNSSCFVMETADNAVKITTKGKGNGLGVSLYAADYMAKNGSTCEEILNKFYANTTIMTE